MNPESLATPDRYVYVVRAAFCFSLANLRRGREEDESDGRLDGRRRGRKRIWLWSHMTMYDEGMMDEGAASLRDRDMITSKRGGPAVHPSVSLSFTRGWLVFASFAPRPSAAPSPPVTSSRTLQRTHRSSRTHPCHRPDRSRCHILRTRLYRAERSCSLTIPACQCLLCPVHTVPS